MSKKAEQMFPENRELGNAEKLRIFKADKAALKRAAEKLGVEEDEMKRRAIHVGVRELAEMLGIDVDEPRKKAA